MSQEIFVDGAYHETSSGSIKREMFNMGDRHIANVLNGLASNQRMGQVRHTRLTLAGKLVTILDATTAGAHGGLELLSFPEGRVLVLGAMTDLAILAGAGGIADDAEVVAAIGSVVVATNNAALTSTEADLIASVAATLTAGAADFNGASAAAGLALNGVAGAKSLFLNFAVPDADSSADDTIAVTGTIDIFWIYLGDS